MTRVTVCFPFVGKHEVSAIYNDVPTQGFSMTTKLYSPKAVYAKTGETPPRVLAAPQRYIQGPGVVDQIGIYIAHLEVKRAAILGSQRGLNAEGARVAHSLKLSHIESINAGFSGECSIPEIQTHVANLMDKQIDCLIVVGGGKPIDAGKCIAHRLGIPVIVVPTLASNDAPCSALSAIYSESGVSDYIEYFPKSPELVIVDTDVIANADERYLVAGMGDAMATWYEARVCLNNSVARTPLGGRPTLAACALGEVCAHTLYEHGEAAATSVAANRNNESVEKVVEANTLLSGIGFESGGLAIAHAMSLAFTRIEVVQDNYLHGEMVAMGTMAQLAFERSDDLQRVARFFAKVGLPVHLGQISLAQKNSLLDIVVEATLANPIAHHMPTPVTHDLLLQAILDANQLGQTIGSEVGDQAYRRLRA